MKVLAAWCLRCGYTTDDLDLLDAHTAGCRGHLHSRARDVSCSECDAQPGDHCHSRNGRRVDDHIIRWDTVLGKGAA